METGWRVNSDRVITVVCWVGIGVFGLAALGALVSVNVSGILMCLSLAGLCAFVLLRRAENAALAPADGTSASEFETPTVPPSIPLMAPSQTLPARVTQKWLTANVPQMNQFQVPSVLHELRSRGWTDEKIQTKVLPLIRHW
ncbi:hypothetical protein SMNI109538_00255 [Smaragdicoccus niigatensis]